MRPDRPAADPDTEVFYVGDEFQSIYGFRHADVEVFRERRRNASSLLALRQNYRSRPEVLAAVNQLFGEEFGEEFQPLTASGEFPDPVLGHPVELLVTDKSSYAETPVHWRRGEARHIAARARELVDNGDATAGEIVLLFAAGTNAEWYEEELRRVGLPTYRATGGGYFGQQQVVDLLAYLSLLHNRYDDVALVTVLASPFVGVSNDALLLLRRTIGRRPLFGALERPLPEALAEDDRRLLLAFRQRYERLVLRSARVSLERLCELVLVEHDYDLAVLARWDGRRRFANLRKLARLARSYEALRGVDLAGFVRFARDQAALGSKELEAVAEEEGADAVRLLTIHAAKGLEFKVVIVADAGRDTGGPPAADEILALSDGRFGFRVVHPTKDTRTPVFDYEDVKAERERQSRAERLRLYYVAMTRAIDRLIVSGAIDANRTADEKTPLGWVLNRLDAADEVTSAETLPVELVRGQARWLLRVDRFDPDRESRRRRRPSSPTTSSCSSSRPPRRLFRCARRSSSRRSRRSRHHRCTCRVGSRTARSRSSSAARTATGPSVSPASVRGRCPSTSRPAGRRRSGSDGARRRSASPARARAAVGSCRSGPRAPRGNRPQLVSASSPSQSSIGSRSTSARGARPTLAARVATLDGAAPERPFAFLHDGVLLQGRLDVLWRHGDRALVVDYKTNRLDERDPQTVIEDEYELQRLVYALALLRDGVEEVEIAYSFLDRPDEPVCRTFTAEETPELEAALSAAITRIREGDFRPRPSTFACAGCPALDVVCAGPRLADEYGPIPLPE